jgi:hypothetical protein
MAIENPRWGYTRIRGALMNLGHEIGRNTVKRVLAENGIDPAGRRPMAWKTFLRAHWGAIAATDFLTRRGRHMARSRSVLRALRDRLEEPSRGDRRHHSDAERGIDAAGRSEFGRL